ncbi:MAG: TlpA disulfide reductase family protein [Pirellulales bacterium]
MLCCGALVGATALVAQDGTKAEPAKAESKVEKAAYDPAAVPADLPGLLEYVKQGENWQPPVDPAMRRDPEAMKKIRDQIKTARGKLVEATDKALALKPEEQNRVQLTKAKLNALRLMGMFGDEQADKTFETLIDSLLKDKNPALSGDAYKLSLMIRLNRIMSGKGGESPDKLAAELSTALDKDETRAEAVMVAQNATYMFEMKGHTELARKLYDDLIKAAPKLDDSRMRTQVQKRAEGGIARLGLIGRPAELKGKLLDGADFDVTSLKGKVVLIDFWATWCGPCIAEMPNVVENYKKYHDKGFEVVGVSIDDDKEKLETFVKEKDVQWRTLFNPDEATRGFENPSAKAYFVNGIPATYLVDKSGNITAINVRGERLGELLESLLGK